MAADLSFGTGVSGASRSYIPATRKSDGVLAAHTDKPIVEVDGPTLGAATDSAILDPNAGGTFSLMALAKGTNLNLRQVLGALAALLKVDTVVKASSTSRSGTIANGGQSQQLMAANGDRRGFSIQNQSTNDLYINGLAAAASDQSSLKIPPNALYESTVHHVGTGQINIFGSITGQAFYAREF